VTLGLFAKEKPEQVTVRTGERLACQVCGFDLFFLRNGQLSIGSARADCAVCGRCGYVHWFLGSDDGRAISSTSSR